MKKKGCLIAGITAMVLYLITAGAAIFVSMTQREDFFSSPTASRDTAAYRKGSLGLLEEPDLDFDQYSPAGQEFGAFEKSEEGETLTLRWSPLGKTERGTAIDPQEPVLVGDDEIELVAFATWYPQASDSLEGEAAYPLRFYDAASLLPLTGEGLLARGVDPAMLTMGRAIRYETPRIRLLFRTETIEAVRILELNLGDQRTGARVSYDLEKLSELESRSRQVGNWTSADAALLLWHGTPLDISLAILTGDPEHQALPREEGARIHFGDQLRLEWVADFPQRMNVDLDRNDRLSVVCTPRELSAGAKAEPETLLRASSESYLQHCGRVSPRGIDWEWKEREDEEPLYLAAFPNPESRRDPIEFVFVPSLTELTFSIAGIPQAPNKGEIDDLFEITLPRITLPEENGERNLIGLLSTAAQIEFDYDLLWSDSPPEQMPPDRTFYNETPQSLLNWYLDHTRGSFVNFDEMKFHMSVNERDETWWEEFVTTVKRVF